jgi:hypothetical protein
MPAPKGRIQRQVQDPQSQSVDSKAEGPPTPLNQAVTQGQDGDARHQGQDDTRLRPPHDDGPQEVGHSDEQDERAGDET